MVENGLYSLCNLCILCLDWVRASRKVKNPTADWSVSVASFCSLSSIIPEVVKASASCSSTLQDPSGDAATPLPHGNLRPK